MRIIFEGTPEELTNIAQALQGIERPTDVALHTDAFQPLSDILNHRPATKGIV